MLKSVKMEFDLSLLEPPQIGAYRCKIVYGDEIVSVEYTPYIKREIKRLKVVSSDISYDFKYLDRREIDALYAAKGDCDDVLISKNGLLRDTSIANIALLKNNRWLTPSEPLLAGTMRQKLIDTGFLTEAEISIAEIGGFEAVAIMNALRGFEPLGAASDVIRF